MMAYGVLWRYMEVQKVYGIYGGGLRRVTGVRPGRVWTGDSEAQFKHPEHPDRGFMGELRPGSPRRRDGVRLNRSAMSRSGFIVKIGAQRRVALHFLIFYSLFCSFNISANSAA